MRPSRVNLSSPIWRHHRRRRGDRHHRQQRHGAAAAAATGGLSIDYDIVSNWGSGFTASMAVGAGSAALAGWTVAFDASFNITSIWNATIVSHVGNHTAW